MAKKIKGLIGLILVGAMLLVFASCKKDDAKVNADAQTTTQNAITTTENAETKPAKEDKLPLEDAVFTDENNGNKVSITYPKFSVQREYYDSMNKQIQEFAAQIPQLLFGKDYKNVTLDIKYELKRADGDVLSIAYVGNGFVKGTAHPQNVYLTQNFDVANQKLIKFSDCYTVDSTTAKAFLKYAKDALKAEEFEAFNISYANEEDVLNALKNCDTISEEGVWGEFSYHTKTSIGVKFPVAHAAGDFVFVEVPYSEFAK